MMSRYIVAISGASGSIYGVGVIKALVSAGHSVAVTASREGLSILKDEVGYDWAAADENETAYKIQTDLHLELAAVSFHSEDNLYAPISSGSYITAGMFIAPCSMKTLAGIANGYANNLIERAADVVLKERTAAASHPARDPALINTLREHAEALAPGGTYPPCHARVLQPPEEYS